MSNMEKLYDIPSLPFSMMQEKYLQTNDLYDDPNTLENFMKEAIRDTSSDKPLFESDMPRRSHNPMSQAFLSTQEFGGRYTHAPNHAELFLGDLTKDQRMSATDPLVAQMAEQNRFRQQRYIAGKLQDVADVRTEKILGEKAMLKTVAGGFNDTAKRLRELFDDSDRIGVRRANPNPGTAMKQVDDALLEEDTIYKNRGEQILPKYTGITTYDERVVQFQAEQDSKRGISSINTILKAGKPGGDQSIVAANRSGVLDTKIKDGFKSFQTSNKIRQVGSLKQARKDLQSAEVKLGNDSKKNQKHLSKMLPPMPVDHVERFKRTQKQARAQVETKGVVYKYTKGNNRQESLMEPIKDKTLEEAKRSVMIPPKDRIAIMHTIKRTQKSAKPEGKTPSRSLGVKALAKAFTVQLKPLEEQSKKDGMQTERYANGTPNTSIDHVSTVRTTDRKFAKERELMVANATGSNAMPQSITLNDFEFDTDPTMNNNYFAQTRGGIQRNPRLTPIHDQDSMISPLNDTITPFRTKYR